MATRTAFTVNGGESLYKVFRLSQSATARIAPILSINRVSVSYSAHVGNLIRPARRMTPFCPREGIIAVEVAYQSPKIKGPFDRV